MTRLLAGSLWFLIGVAPMAVVDALAQGSPSSQPPGGSLQGLWRNGDTTIRLKVSKAEVKGEFVEVGQVAKDLGFKAGDQSFTAVKKGAVLQGEQIIRYGASQPCYKEKGRSVPLTGFVSDDGKQLLLDNYNFRVDPTTCKDTGDGGVNRTVWERVPGK